MKISSKIEVCNLALSRIGQNSISSLEDDSSVQAQFCNMVYEQSKSALLAQYNWTFAISSAKLVKVDNTEDDFKEYTYKYALPEGFLRLMCLYDNNNHEIVPVPNTKPIFKLEGKYIFSDFSDCKLKFIKDMDAVAEFSPMFIDCFVLDLAIRLTKLFNNSSTYLQQLQMEYLQQIAKAKISDCQQTELSGIQSYPILFSTWAF